MVVYTKRTLSLIPDPTLVALGYDVTDTPRRLLCVAWEFSDLMEPVLYTDYYPIRHVSLDFYATLEGRAVYPWVKGAYKDKFGEVYYLKNRGETTPVYRTQRPAPAPRAKDLRWVRGGWEKYTKAKGWQSVGIPDG